MTSTTDKRPKSRFKLNDKVVCTDASGVSFLTKGRTYLVRWEPFEGRIAVLDDWGDEVYLPENRFEPAPAPARGDWAATLARNFCGSSNQDDLAAEFRRIEAAGYTRGHIAGELALAVAPTAPVPVVPGEVERLRAGIEGILAALPQADPGSPYDELGGYLSYGNYGDVIGDAVAWTGWDIAQQLRALLQQAAANPAAPAPVVPGELRELSKAATPGTITYVADPRGRLLHVETDLEEGQKAGLPICSIPLKREGDAAFLVECWNFVRALLQQAGQADAAPSSQESNNA